MLFPVKTQTTLCTLSPFPTLDHNVDSIFYHYPYISSATMEMCKAPKKNYPLHEPLISISSKFTDSQEPPQVLAPTPYALAHSARTTYTESQYSRSEGSPRPQGRHSKSSSHHVPTGAVHHTSQVSAQVLRPEPNSLQLNESKNLNKEHTQSSTHVFYNDVCYTNGAPGKDTGEGTPRPKPLAFSSIISISTAPLAIPHQNRRQNRASRPHSDSAKPSLRLRFERMNTRTTLPWADGTSMHVEPSENVEVPRPILEPVPKKTPHHRPFGGISSLCMTGRPGTPSTMTHINSGSCHTIDMPVTEDEHGVSEDPQRTGIYCLELHR